MKLCGVKDVLHVKFSHLDFSLPTSASTFFELGSGWAFAALVMLPQDDTFLERSDLDKLQAETQRILEDEVLGLIFFFLGGQRNLKGHCRVGGEFY